MPAFSLQHIEQLADGLEQPAQQGACRAPNRAITTPPIRAPVTVAKNPSEM